MSMTDDRQSRIDTLHRIREEMAGMSRVDKVEFILSSGMAYPSEWDYGAPAAVKWNEESMNQLIADWKWEGR